MPIHRGKDRRGPYFQWGNHATKYYYKSGDKQSRERAYKKCIKQMKAIFSSGYRGG